MARHKDEAYTRGYGDRVRRIKYLEGSAARELEEGIESGKVPSRKRLSHRARKNRDKASHMNLGYVLFLSVAIAFAVATLYGYLNLQADIQNCVELISEMELRYNNLKLANDEEYNRINSSVDLEKIKSVAIGELGMTYAGEGQIIRVEDAGADYVRQTDQLK